MNLNPFTRLRAWLNQPVLKRISEIEIYTVMKLSEIKAQVAAASKRSTEAFAEVGTRITALQTQIDELLAGNSDPEVTDEQFAADLATLKANIDQLADIVPAVPTAPAPDETIKPPTV
jgi:hypothetical protein